MSLRNKTLLIIGVILAGLIAAAYAVSSTILLDSYSKLEEQYTRQNVERVRDALAEELAVMNSTLSDWSAWDETYAFIQDANLAYVQGNLSDLTFINLRLSLMVFVDSSGRIVYSKAVDLKSGRQVPVPQGLETHLFSDSPLLQRPDTKSSLTGLIILPEGPMLVASRPILTNEEEGPARGTLIIGRSLDAAEVQALSSLTHLSLAVYLYDDVQLPADLQAARPHLLGGEDPVVWSSAKMMAGYALLRDVYGKPALILQVNTSRAIYQQGQTSMGYLLLSLLVVGLVFGEVTLFLLERSVLSRVAHLSATVSSIGASGNPAVRVSLPGKDELSRLAGDINGMLQTLEQSQQELRKSQELLEKRVEERTAELARVAERLAAVNRIARAASATLQLDDLIETVYREVTPLFQCDSFFIALYDPDTAELDLRLRVDEGVREPPERLPLGKTLAASVVTERKPLLIRDLEEEKDRWPPAELWGTGKPSRSWLGVPMRVGDRVVGVISIQAYHPDAYGEEEQQLLSLIADQVAVAEENARLYTSTRARADELALLYEIGMGLTSTLDFSAVVQAALSRILRLFHAEDVSLLLTDSWSGALRFVRTMTAGGTLVDTPIRPGWGEGLAGWALENCQPVLAEDVLEDERFSEQVDRHTANQPRALMAVPLLTPDYTVGVIEVGSSQPGAYSGHDLHTLQAMASTLTVALVNARLYSETNTLLREREQAQAQLVHAEKMAALGRLVASIAHEINNPLQAVQLCLTLVEEELESGQGPPQSFLGVIRGEIERISAIVRRMHDFYRPAREELEPVDLHTVLDSVLELTGQQLQHSKVTVERVWAGELPRVQANPDHLKQVFLNLVLNAVAAMPEGGILRIVTAADVMPDRDDRRVLSAVRIEFSDTGVGMPPEVLSRLFEPFFTTKADGSGLGLSISYGIIQSHNGQITVTSQEGEGTRFSILLPVEQP